ncbi:TlpA disulfide reductase family protein [Labilibaculum manganireducens]|uniref:TlpA family protein disulfide reductase n=1 Tax=Labilibaculum manganireducens TaxID=1940525 RepID=UPI0029F58AAF|nr:TlpA disulfide reductase family protein [Labilibaculum manganireducens]
MNKLLITLLTILSTLSLSAQDKILTIGDKIPEFNYSKWIKGNPIDNFDDGKVYVFEFWATWCGPCIASMPHLSQIAKKYEGKLEVVGVNVKEKVGDKSYQSLLPKIEKFVKSQGDRMLFNVVADNNNFDIERKWLEAAKIEGIPVSFIVKNNVIQWIGHPSEIESVIDEILENTYDLMSFKSKYDSRFKNSTDEDKKQEEYSMKLKAAMDAKNYNLALQIMDDYTQKNPNGATAIIPDKFNLLLDYFSEEKAIKFAKEIQEKIGFFGSAFAFYISEKEGLKKETYLFGVDLVKDVRQAFSKLYLLESMLYLKAGDLKNSYESQLKAVGSICLELKDKKYEGFVTKETMDEYEMQASILRGQLEKIFEDELRARINAAQTKN